jgi:hypothetical protein
LLLCLILFSVVFVPVFGLGIMPARTEFPYEPGTVHNLTLTITDNDRMSMDIVFITQGELASSISFVNQTVHLTDQQSVYLPITFTIPSGLKPGLHEGLIGPLQLPPNGGKGISAVVSVLTQLRVRVPYPNKYAEIEISAYDISLSDTEQFTIKLHNYGNETINLAQGKVEIYDDYGLAGEAQIDPAQNIAPSSATEMSANWKPQKAGIYHAYAVVDYDGLSTSSENRTFRVGDIYMEIQGVEPRTLISGEINTLAVDAQSKWNSPLEAYANIQLLDPTGRRVLAEGGSKPETFKSWETKSLTDYLDLKNVPAGTYPGLVTLYYAGKTTNMSAEFSVVAPAGQVVYMTGTYYLLLLILIIVILLLIYFKKREKKEEGR